MPERRCPSCGTTWTGGEGLPGVCPECGAEASEARAMFDRALFQAFPGNMTHVHDKANADLLWSYLRRLVLADVWSEGYRLGVQDMEGTTVLDVARRNPYREVTP